MSVSQILRLQIEINTKNERIFFRKLCKKECKKSYSNLDMENVTDNKFLWKTMKPFLSDKMHPRF